MENGAGAFTGIIKKAGSTSFIHYLLGQPRYENDLDLYDYLANPFWKQP